MRRNLKKRQGNRMRGPIVRVLMGILVLLGLVAAPVLGGASAAEARALQGEHQLGRTLQAPAQDGRQGVDDFTFNSFAGDYTLGRDAGGHSTLTTVETFDAQFPDFDQNRGFIRSIPLKYQGQSTDVTIVSVTDGQGRARPYSTESNDGSLQLTLAGDDYVQGRQTYVITFTQKNVTRYFENTNDDEFYWDTIGTAAQQPTASATATVHVPADLARSLTGSTGCYVGPQGSTNTCEASTVADASGAVTYTTEARPLAAYENVTVVLGFAPGTFTPRDSSLFASGAGIASLVLSVLALFVMAAAIVNRVTGLRDARGRPTIIPEYTPPPGVDLLTASVVGKKTHRGIAASIVSLAVRRAIQIVEQQPPGGGAKSYWLRLVTPRGLDETELTLANLLFGEPLVSGAWKQLEKRDTVLAKGTSALLTTSRANAAAEGYLRSGRIFIASGLLLLAVVVVAIAAFVTGVIALAADYGGVWPVLFLMISAVSIVVVALVSFRRPLTAKGAELRDYLRGLELYIRLAEKDRLEMLQSPQGAVKTRIPNPGDAQVVRIYEKLLPFAVLFDLEKEWSKVLGTYYESLGAQPDWYGGNTGAFNAAYFASSVASLSSSVNSTLAASSSSSSFGGSGGGGFSGGGGGGGGTSGV